MQANPDTAAAIFLRRNVANATTSNLRPLWNCRRENRAPPSHRQHLPGESIGPAGVASTQRSHQVLVFFQVRA